MLVFNNESYYQSTALLSIKGITHAFSTRMMGDMRESRKRRLLLKLLHISSPLVLSEQIHGNVVVPIGRFYQQKIKGADGIFIQKKIKNGVLPPIGILVADCVPLLFSSMDGTAVAVAHAGWKGTLIDIAVNTVHLFADAGVEAKDIVVSMGPHIGKCCYNVPEARAKKFLLLYGSDSRVAFQKNGMWHLDLTMANSIQLLKCGILKEHIDIDERCTVDYNNELFSFRGDSKESFGEMLGVISMK